MKKDIRNLLWVIAMALVAAVGVSAWFVLHFAPSGSYTLQNTLLKPELLARLNYNDLNPKTGQRDRYVFDKIVFSFWDGAKKKWGSLEIDIPTYERFYKKVEGDKSLEEPPSSVQSFFTASPPSRLALVVRTESDSAWQRDAKPFLQVEFAERGDYYRVELHEEGAREPWVYFYHPKIFQDITELFIP